jgi:hypothetical protein
MDGVGGSTTFLPVEHMTEITREHLDAYLDDALSEGETARVEQALRASEPLRRQLRGLLTERDSGDHSIGAIWRRQRLSCPSREQLGSYLLQVLDAEQQQYIAFHLETIGCPFCQANLADLQTRQQESVPAAQKRRKRFFQTSAGLLQARKNKPR